MRNLDEVLAEQLKDLYSAENQLIDALPQMAESAATPELAQIFKQHLSETKKQVERLEKISQILDEELDGEECKAMRGLIKESNDILKKDYEIPELRDVMLVAAAQRVEHYEIAGYGNAIALSNYLGKENVTKLLQKSIDEEEVADKKLTEICEGQIFLNSDTFRNLEETRL